jgi:hypothetical protein
MMKEILEAFEEWAKKKTGLPVLFDPQPVRSAEPHIRLTFTGSGEAGKSYDVLTFQLTIVGAGDGPEVFLDSIITASLAVQDLYNRELNNSQVDIVLPNNRGSFRVSFPDVINSTGQFIQNDGSGGETGKWDYIYTEPHVVEFTINRALR